MKKQERFERGAGILLPIFSLPSDYGIGGFDEAAYSFVDFLYEAGQRYWQILPLNPTGYGDSPYQSCCAFAGNPYFINIKEVMSDEVLKREKKGFTEYIDYAYLYENRIKNLKESLIFVPKSAEIPYKRFCDENSFWLDDYALFMTIKEKNGNRIWTEWEDERLKNHDTEALYEFSREHKEELDFWRYLQFTFFSQWDALKRYANEKGISIIGDIPIYVSLDSSDVWANRELFLLHSDGCPIEVAGVPPDAFSEDGQLWGNPIYNWHALEERDFLWWKKRVEFCSYLYDAIRIDHFIGIVNYYSIPASADNAKNGRWHKAPARALVSSFEGISGIKIIAENLGNITDEVTELLEECGFPGMKILQFAFGGDETNPNLPHNFEQNSVVYGGTHDNQTLLGYFSSCSEKELDLASYILNQKNKSPLAISKEIIRAGLSSVADIAIFSIQDYLALDDRARINTPSVAEGNWQWRLSGKRLTPKLTEEIKAICRSYNR